MQVLYNEHREKSSRPVQCDKLPVSGGDRNRNVLVFQLLKVSTFTRVFLSPLNFNTRMQLGFFFGH